MAWPDDVAQCVRFNGDTALCERLPQRRHGGILAEHFQADFFESVGESGLVGEGPDKAGGAGEDKQELTALCDLLGHIEQLYVVTVLQAVRLVDN